MDAIWTIAAHGANSSLMNWLSTNYTLIPSGSTPPAFTIDQGGAGNGSTAYYRTQYDPSGGTLKYKQDDASIGGYCRTSGVDAGYFIGSTSGSIHLYVQPKPVTTYADFVMNSNGGNCVIGSTDGRGLFVITRTSSSNINVYKNTTKLSNASSTSNGIPNEPFILANDQYYLVS